MLGLLALAAILLVLGVIFGIKILWILALIALVVGCLLLVVGPDSTRWHR